MLVTLRAVRRYSYCVSRIVQIPPSVDRGKTRASTRDSRRTPRAAASATASAGRVHANRPASTPRRSPRLCPARIAASTGREAGERPHVHVQAPKQREQDRGDDEAQAAPRPIHGAAVAGREASAMGVADRPSQFEARIRARRGGRRPYAPRTSNVPLRHSRHLILEEAADQLVATRRWSAVHLTARDAAHASQIQPLRASPPAIRGWPWSSVASSRWRSCSVSRPGFQPLPSRPAAVDGAPTRPVWI